MYDSSTKSSVFNKAIGLINVKPLTILFCVWAAMQLLLFLIMGIVTDKEAVKYSDEAQFVLQNGYFSQPKYIFYAAYIFLHVLFWELGFETTGVYLVQLLTNLLAMYCLYKTSYHITKKKDAAFITVLFLLLCHLWQYWTVFLYTESLFCNFIIIFIFLLFGTGWQGRGHKVLTGIIFLVILLARPTGMYFIPVAGLLVAYRMFVQRKIFPAVSAIAFTCTLFLVLVSYAMKGGSSFDFMKPLLEHNVLCYITEDSAGSRIKNYATDNTLFAVAYFIKEHPAGFLKLAGLKFISFWGITRPHFSTLHNIVLMCYFYPVYCFAVAGFWFAGNHLRGLKFFVAGTCIIFTLSVIVICDDWTSRFIMPVIPPVILMAGIGITAIFSKRSLLPSDR